MNIEKLDTNSGVRWYGEAQTPHYPRCPVGQEYTESLTAGAQINRPRVQNEIDN